MKRGEITAEERTRARRLPFRPEMVRGIRMGIKTMSRRVIQAHVGHENPKDDMNIYGWPGDLLLVTEMFCPTGDGKTIYSSDCVGKDARLVKELKWTSSRFMPKWASRMLLRIEDVWPEPLKEITEQEALMEGIGSDRLCPCVEGSARLGFFRYWDLLNGDKGFTVKLNPWVWVIKFKQIK